MTKRETPALKFIRRLVRDGLIVCHDSKTLDCKAAKRIETAIKRAVREAYCAGENDAGNQPEYHAGRCPGRDRIEKKYGVTL